MHAAFMVAVVDEVAGLANTMSNVPTGKAYMQARRERSVEFATFALSGQKAVWVCMPTVDIGRCINIKSNGDDVYVEEGS